MLLSPTYEVRRRPCLGITPWLVRGSPVLGLHARYKYILTLWPSQDCLGGTCPKQSRDKLNSPSPTPNLGTHSQPEPKMASQLPTTLHPHHTTTLLNTITHFSPDPSVLALLLSGSLAHGFATPTSDVDILVILTAPAYAARRASGQLTFVSTDLAPYPGGYVDAKFLSLDFMRDVAQRGSEAARFAFEGATVVFAREEEVQREVEGLVKQAVRYPVEGKEERVRRFRAQVEAWRWFCGEGRKKGDKYLVGLAARKLVLFGGRLVLAHNEVLYPFHKWLRRSRRG